MSELKAMTVLDVQQMGCYDNVFVYFKSEADKVIAEKDTEIERLETLYHRCRIEMTRVYKKKDELAQRIKDMEANK